MKKFLSVLLALLVMLSGISAFASEADLVGDWMLTQASAEGMTFGAADLGVEMTVTLNADGTATMSMTSDGTTEAAEGSWIMIGDVVTITADNEPADFTYENGRLALTEDGVTMYLDKDGIIPADAEPSMDLSGLLGESEVSEGTAVEAAVPNADELIGAWTLAGASSSGIELTPEALGMEMSVVLNADFTAVISVVTADSSEEDTGSSWGLTATGATLTDSTGDSLSMYLEDGLLVLDDNAGTLIYLAPADASAVAAPAEAEKYLGVWVTAGVLENGVEKTVEEFGTNLTVECLADYTMIMNASSQDGSEDDVGTWALTETGLALTDSSGTVIYAQMENGRLALDFGDNNMIYLVPAGETAAAAEEAPVAASSDLTTFTNAEQGYSISYPSDWYPMTQEYMDSLAASIGETEFAGMDSATIQSSVAQAAAQGLHMVYLPDFASNFNITGNSLGMTADTAMLQALCPTLQAQLQATFGETFSVVDSGSVVQYGANEYVQMSYTYELEGVSIFCTQCMISFNDALYVVTLSYPNDGTNPMDPYLPELEAMLASLKPAE